jgi:O-antigen ligase
MLIDPNAYGGLLAVTFAVHAITYYSPKPILGGIAGGILAVTLVAGILFTYSRSTWISVTFLLCIAMAMNWRRAGYLLCTIAVIIAIVWFMADVDYLDEMAEMAKRPDQVEVRVEVLNRAMALFLENPVFGVGLGMFDTVARETDRLSESYAVIIHNTTAWFLTEFGLVGFAMFAAFIVWYWVTGFKAYRAAPVAEKPVVLGLVAAHTAMMGLSMGIEALYQRHWWLVMALIAASRNAAETPVTLSCAVKVRDKAQRWVPLKWRSQGF